MMRRALGWVFGVVLVALLSQPSCQSLEREAMAAEGTDATTRDCDIGAMVTVALCGGVAASCHVCARIETKGQCVQPCAVGGNECGAGLRCHPIEALLDSGYARMGDCPTGYCQ